MKNGTQLFAGLTNLVFDEDDDGVVELGQGLEVRRTYAHLNNSFIVAFSPAPPGKHNPTPWRAAQGGAGYDVFAELFIPSSYQHHKLSNLEVAKVILCLMRLRLSPSISLALISPTSLSDASVKTDSSIPLIPIEVAERFLKLEFQDESLAIHQLYYVRNN